ncbi:hypothetical protein [Thalassiella azotivora]
MKIRQLAPTAALSIALVGVGAPAFANPTYPPTTPEPTETAVEVLPTEQEQAAADTEVLGSSLARTGSELAVAGGIGAALVVAGAGAVVVARKRSTARQ